MPPLGLGTVPPEPIPERLDLCWTEYRFDFLPGRISRGEHHRPDRLPGVLHSSLVAVQYRPDCFHLRIVEVEFVAEGRQ